MSTFTQIEDLSVAFTPWPKISRLGGDMIVTEKLDGTNAAIGVLPNGSVYAQSRTRIITPGKSTDNYGFAGWVQEHADELRDGLGEGLHFGEWWGQGIQRGYGLAGKRFSLFNTSRWTCYGNGGDRQRLPSDWVCHECPIVSVVPVLTVRTFDSAAIEDAFSNLKENGSVAAPGFPNPEGVVVYFNRAMFKLSDAK